MSPYAGPHSSLRSRIRLHDWTAQPDAAYVMSQRIDLLRDLCALPLRELADLLRSLNDPELASQIFAQVDNFRR